jgi:hypothetical protein
VALGLGVRLAGVPGLAVTLIDALGGGGILPSWIRFARCATAGGNDGPTIAAAPARRPNACAGAPGASSAAGAGLLMTVLMIVVLWMLLKMMLFGGGTTYAGGLQYTGIGTNTGCGRMNNPMGTMGGDKITKSSGGGGR